MKNFKKIISSMFLATFFLLFSVIDVSATSTISEVDEQLKLERFNQEVANDDSIIRIDTSDLHGPSLFAHEVLPGGGGWSHKGDILITQKNIPGGGFTGHAGIAIGSGKILHIAGPGYTPKVITESQWLSSYPSTAVIRYKYGTTVPSKAADWVKSTYQYGSGRNADYWISSNLVSTDPTYCSKIVWQGYYYGAGKMFKTAGMKPYIITPYDFLNYRTSNGFATQYLINFFLFRLYSNSE